MAHGSGVTVKTNTKFSQAIDKVGCLPFGEGTPARVLLEAGKQSKTTCCIVCRLHDMLYGVTRTE